jgi:hypothetical protein
MRLGAIVVLTLSAGTACGQNVTFSFASDTDSENPTFKGSAGDGHMHHNRVNTDLKVDDANGGLPTLDFDTKFYHDFELTTIGSTLLPSGQYLHTYEINGSFSFQASVVMEVTITDGVFTSLGDEDNWGTTATIQASSNAGSGVSYHWMGDDLPAYNLFNDATTSVGTDAAFTLTNLMSFPDVGLGVPGVELNQQTGLPAFSWQSEGSYSGSAFFVPAPSALSLLGLSCMGFVRRKRA